MGIIFKKGHIIPRWCHVKTTDRKAQHNCTFGCDVEVVTMGSVVKMYALSGGTMIEIKGKRGPSRRMKGGSTKYSIAIVNQIHGDFSKVYDSTFIKIPSTNNLASSALPDWSGNPMPEAQWYKL